MKPTEDDELEEGEELEDEDWVPEDDGPNFDAMTAGLPNPDDYAGEMEELDKRIAARRPREFNPAFARAMGIAPQPEPKSPIETYKEVKAAVEGEKKGKLDDLMDELKVKQIDIAQKALERKEKNLDDEEKAEADFKRKRQERKEKHEEWLEKEQFKRENTTPTQQTHTTQDPLYTELKGKLDKMEQDEKARLEDRVKELEKDVKNPKHPVLDQVLTKVESLIPGGNGLTMNGMTITQLTEFANAAGIDLSKSDNPMIAAIGQKQSMTEQVMAQVIGGLGKLTGIGLEEVQGQVQQQTAVPQQVVIQQPTQAAPAAALAAPQTAEDQRILGLAKMLSDPNMNEYQRARVQTELGLNPNEISFLRTGTLADFTKEAAQVQDPQARQIMIHTMAQQQAILKIQLPSESAPPTGGDALAELEKQLQESQPQPATQPQPAQESPEEQTDPSAEAHRSEEILIGKKKEVDGEAAE